MDFWAGAIFAVSALLSSVSALGSQIGPLGSAFEASLTNEPESNLAKVAGHLGLLIKAPVHEEITQLGFGCPTDGAELGDFNGCSKKDLPFVTPFVIYGVRWNDLPPFRLAPGEGANCKRIFTSGAACRADQTVRFSTQPECWYCLFKDAERRAKRKTIAGCKKGAQYIRGNLMTRSHFGDLQFLHAMASGKSQPALVTQTEILHWLEFAWKVATYEFGPDHKLRDVELSTFQDRFHCSGWTVADIYILGRSKQLESEIPSIALGSVLHLVQDSFSAAHVDRVATSKDDRCSLQGAEHMARPGLIRQFHTYTGQVGSLHDAEDERSAMVSSVRNRHPEALAMTGLVKSLYNNRDPSWSRAEPFFRCMFDLIQEPLDSAPGERFSVPTAREGGP